MRTSLNHSYRKGTVSNTELFLRCLERLSLISKLECEASTVSKGEADKFLEPEEAPKDDTDAAPQEDAEDLVSLISYTSKGQYAWYHTS